MGVRKSGALEGAPAREARENRFPPLIQLPGSAAFSLTPIRELKQLRRRPQRRLQKTIGLMMKTTAQHVHHTI